MMQMAVTKLIFHKAPDGVSNINTISGNSVITAIRLTGAYHYFRTLSLTDRFPRKSRIPGSTRSARIPGA